MLPDVVTRKKLSKDLDKEAAAAQSASAEAARRPVYVIDSGVFFKLLQKDLKHEDVLRNTAGIVLGFLDEQDKVAKMIRETGAGSWLGISRPFKHSILLQKLALVAAFSNSDHQQHHHQHHLDTGAEAAPAPAGSQDGLPRTNSKTSIISDDLKKTRCECLCVPSVCMCVCLHACFMHTFFTATHVLVC
jgi:hypothetical protein